jgi:DNA-binding MarR family transcriptional regulator
MGVVLIGETWDPRLNEQIVSMFEYLDCRDNPCLYASLRSCHVSTDRPHAQDSDEGLMQGAIPSAASVGDEHARASLLDMLDRERRTSGALSVLRSHLLADHIGINSTDLECLDILDLYGPITAGRLAELTGLASGSVTALVDRMAKAGWVRRTQDPRDRRRVIIELVPEQVRVILPHFAPLTRAMAALYARYSDDELALIVDFSTRSNQVLSEENSRLRGKPVADTIRRQADTVDP